MTAEKSWLKIVFLFYKFSNFSPHSDPACAEPQLGIFPPELQPDISLTTSSKTLAEKPLFAGCWNKFWAPGFGLASAVSAESGCMDGVEWSSSRPCWATLQSTPALDWPEHHHHTPHYEIPIYQQPPSQPANTQIKGPTARLVVVVVSTPTSLY